ncbi:MAG: TIGR00730 family Rossman fold protein [Clostridiales bacterium]|nr:TIGR00730 family Rossman fold protein [Clostridiales bacterium]
MNKVICVFSSSSNTIDNIYFDAASKLGREIAEREDLLLFGGGHTGLMGACARAVHQNNGKVIGVIPEALNLKGVVYENCDELVVTKGMRERKAKMDHRSDAFIALPGGYGTLEEILEIITLKQLRYHNKPIVILNINGFFNHLLEQFETVIHQQFAKSICCDLYYVTDDVADCINYIENYSPMVFEERWLTDVEKQ